MNGNLSNPGPASKRGLKSSSLSALSVAAPAPATATAAVKRPVKCGVVCRKQKQTAEQISASLVLLLLLLSQREKDRGIRVRGERERREGKIKRVVNFLSEGQATSYSAEADLQPFTERVADLLPDVADMFCKAKRAPGTVHRTQRNPRSISQHRSPPTIHAAFPSSCVLFAFTRYHFRRLNLAVSPIPPSMSASE